MKTEKEQIYDKARVMDMEFASVDLTIKCKCGEVFNSVDNDMNDWAECPKCNRQYTISFNFNHKNVGLEEN